MWNEIKENGIVAHVTNAKGRFVYTIPEGTASLAGTRLINMTQWLYEEFMRDSSDHSTIFQSRDFTEQEAFVTRNTSRVLSYVNHVCVLEHILIRLYEKTILKLQKIEPAVVSDISELAARKKEVADCFTFRNKVSAHTVYGSPKPEDNSAMEFHSLTALLSTSYDATGSADSFALGAVSVRLAGEDPSTKLPCIGLKELHPKMLEHIKAWTQMLVTPCVKARKKIPIIIDDTKYTVE